MTAKRAADEAQLLGMMDMALPTARRKGEPAEVAAGSTVPLDEAGAAGKPQQLLCSLRSTAAEVVSARLLLVGEMPSFGQRLSAMEAAQVTGAKGKRRPTTASHVALLVQARSCTAQHRHATTAGARSHSTRVAVLRRCRHCKTATARCLTRRLRSTMRRASCLRWLACRSLLCCPCSRRSSSAYRASRHESPHW